MGEVIDTLVGTILYSVTLIILGIIYFGVTLWIVKASSEFVFGEGLEANWAALSAAIITVGAIMSGSLDSRKKQNQ
ncbi:MAG: hypothetical protein V1672_04135 [Candidatus Diapherotrites archaeon]